MASTASIAFYRILSSLTLKTSGQNNPNLFQPSSLLPSDSPTDPSEQEVGVAGDLELSDRREALKHKLLKLRHDIRLASGEEKSELVKQFETMRQVSVSLHTHYVGVTVPKCTHFLSLLVPVFIKSLSLYACGMSCNM